MSYRRTSLLLAIGMIGAGLGASGGCAEGSSVMGNLGSAGSPGADGGASSDARGGLTGIVTGPTAGTTPGGKTATGGTTAVPCAAGLKRCGPECIDVSVSPLHCGDCGKPCPAEARECVSGTCICPAATHAVCDGICSDLRSDLSNCGACGTFCAADRVCTAGVCVCDPARKTTQCGTKCIDLMTDVFHCGACNDTTTPACDAAQVCNQGVCAAACTAPVVKCGPVCADLQLNSAHCGACDKPCDATRVCSGGTCVCAPARQLCGTTCADFQTDSKNCGKCSAVCTPGTECSKGTCVCMLDATKCTVGGTSGAAGAAGTAGAPGSIVCVDTTAHPQHCGACNTPCTASESCISSTCTCMAPAMVCGTPALCTDLQTSNAHCGACGNACAATAHCEAGVCVCTAPNVDCGSGCVDTSKTAAHCGACNQPCVGNQICSSSVCVSGDIRVYTMMQQLPLTTTTVSNSIATSVRVCNIGSTTANLNGAKIKYWYSMDGAGGEQIAVSYSSPVPITIAAVAVDPMRGETDYTIVATLPATASLGPGTAATPTCIDGIQLSVHAGTTYAPGYLVANDWSYLAQSVFTLNDRVTMYIGTAKMWGNEPPVL